MKRNPLLRRATLLIAACACAVLELSAQAPDTARPSFYDCCRPDGHAPIGIMMDHVHGKNEWSVAYSYMNMMMEGNRNGTTSLSDADIYQDYAMAPHTMTMQMHMLMLMYGVTPRITAMAMGSYTMNEMTMHMPASSGHSHGGMNMGGMNMDPSKSSGLGDTKAWLLYKLIESCRQRVVLGLGANIPTGSITVTGATMLGENERLAYPMQPGTGTWSVLPDVVYTGQNCMLSWGGQAAADLKTGTNSEGYAWGNSYSLNGWLAWKCCAWSSISLRAEGITSDAIRGYDPGIAILAFNDPNADAANYGGQRANVYLGFNLYKPRNPVKGIRLQAEYGMPVYQQLNGPQMSQRGTLLAGIQYTF